ncbi:MAG: hypothetical protein JHC87_03150 [Thermoleophilaceae bacterium]|nr:hypothetical protein [Thermoleophilaceae bacterium]
MQAPSHEASAPDADAERIFCGACGQSLEGGAHSCERSGLVTAEFDPARYCQNCGSKLTMQVLPHGLTAECLPCERAKRRL